jgi:hypothetical protein
LARNGFRAKSYISGVQSSASAINGTADLLGVKIDPERPIHEAIPRTNHSVA